MGDDEQQGPDATRAWFPSDAPPAGGHDETRAWFPSDGTEGSSGERPSPAAPPRGRDGLPSHQWSVPAPLVDPSVPPPWAYDEPVVDPSRDPSATGRPAPAPEPPATAWEEALAASAPPVAPPAPPRPKGHRWVLVGFGVAAVVVLLVCAGLVVVSVVGSDGSDGSGDDTDLADAERTGAERLAPEPPMPDADGPFELFAVEPDGDPVAWDPCRPIRFVVDETRAPEGARAILDEAIAEVERATGLVFQDEGATDETAPVDGQARPDTDPERYGEGWSPVLITWTEAGSGRPTGPTGRPGVPGGRGPVAGGAGAESRTVPSWQEAESGEQVYVSGLVQMAGPQTAALLQQGRADDVLGIVMHELGHLVGLDHVDAPDHVMTDDLRSRPSEWGPGDLAGLATVGRGECEPDL